MANDKNVFLRSVQPLIGTAIGVGIFGLPFVFAQAGYFIGLFYLLLLAAVNVIVLVAFGDVIAHTEGHSRLTGLIKRYLSDYWSWFATVISFCSIWAAMVAYIIVGGEFLNALLSPLFGGEAMIYQLLFFAVCSILVLGGLGFVSRVETASVFILLALIFLLLIGSSIYIDPANLITIDFNNWFLPFGVTLFAFSSMSALPEMSQILGKKKHSLRKSIIVGYLVVTAVYCAFTTIVVAVTGAETSEEAIVGLGAAVGNWALVLGSIVGLFAVFNCFLILGLSVMDSLIYDFKQRYLVSWLLAILIPLAIFLIGAKDFIAVISFSGGIFTGILYLLIIAMYFKARKDACLPKRCLLIPSWLLYVCAVILIFGVILTMIK